jgi:hypothetical protein
MITHNGPYDACKGVQLMITALLGQIYGALSKKCSFSASGASTEGRLSSEYGSLSYMPQCLAHKKPSGFDFMAVNDHA